MLFMAENVPRDAQICLFRQQSFDLHCWNRGTHCDGQCGMMPDKTAMEARPVSQPVVQEQAIDLRMVE
jgi:hypothetical protein